MKVETKLARLFGEVASEAGRIESKASQILALVKEGEITNVEKFNETVQAAYAANGWNTKPGRPEAGASKKGEVPDTVRTYVSLVRSAFAADLRVSRYASFYDLRVALAKKRGMHVVKGGKGKPGRAADGEKATGASAISIPEEIVETFRGVHIEEGKPNGGLFHDLALVFLKLKPDERGLFGRQLNRLLGQYRSHAFPAAKPAKAAKRAA
jgi:hypothetical protein